MKNNLKILAIETSCDETAAAVIGETICHAELDSASNRSRNKFGMTGQRPVILSNIISSQIDLHAKTGGVVPEVASRAHMEAIVPVISEALIKSSKGVILSETKDLGDPSPMAQNDKLDYSASIKILQNEIDYIAVTNGPGLIGSLLVGFNAAKSIAYALSLPIVPINHIEGHVYSALAGRINRGKDQVGRDKDDLLLATSYLFPVLALTVSGGHTSLTLMKDHGVYEQIGGTIDDAVGEAYDKVAKLLGLGYPGGPVISKMAEHFRNSSKGQVARDKDHSLLATCLPRRALAEWGYSPLNIVFPRPIIDQPNFNFSFSGLKTAVLIWVKKYLEANRLDSTEKISSEVKAEIAAAFEEAVKDVLVAKTIKAVEKYKPKTVIFAGGVSANQYLRSQIELAVNRKLSTVNFFVPDKDMCGDNAAMIGLAAYYHIQRGDMKNWDEIKVDSNLEL